MIISTKILNSRLLHDHAVTATVDRDLLRNRFILVVQFYGRFLPNIGRIGDETCVGIIRYQFDIFGKYASWRLVCLCGILVGICVRSRIFGIKTGTAYVALELGPTKSYPIIIEIAC